jgi:hypothetical protein
VTVGFVAKVDKAAVRAEPARPPDGIASDASGLVEYLSVSRIRGLIQAYSRSTTRFDTMMQSVAKTTTPWIVGRSNASSAWITVRPGRA